MLKTKQRSWTSNSGLESLNQTFGRLRKKILLPRLKDASEMNPSESAQLTGQQFALGNQWFQVRGRLLAMCKGEFSAVIVGISVCEAGGSGHEELKKCPPISPAICDL